jgi:hypothetical protein
MISEGDNMGRAYEEEKIFAEQLDKALAGQTVSSSAETADELRSSLEFSEKMVALRASPRPQFQSALKANLLVKLNEQEAQRSAGRAWFWKILPREPIWQVITVLAIMVIVGGVVWGTLFQPGSQQVVQAPTLPPSAAGPAPQTSSAPVMTTAAPGTSPPSTVAAPTTTAAATAAPTSSAPSNRYLAADGSTDKSVYQSGEPVKISVSWKNLTSQNLTINEFPPIVSLMESSDAKPVFTFPAGQTSRTLSPGGSAAYTFTWNQKDAQGNPANPGKYYVELEELYFNGQSVKMNLDRPVIFTLN